MDRRADRVDLSGRRPDPRRRWHPRCAEPGGRRPRQGRRRAGRRGSRLGPDERSTARARTARDRPRSRVVTTIGVIQARMGSSRLPGKILASLGDESVLASTVRRLRAASLVDEVIVATTDQADDQETVGAAVSLGARVVRGSLHDVLGRFGTALEEAPGDVIVRVTADCPLLDPSLVDEVIAAVVGGADYATNRLPPPWTRTTPVGLDVEAMSAEALRTALAEATEPHQREHVTPYFYENPDRFGIELIDLPRDLSHLRVTVDTAEDLEIVRRLAPHLTALSRWQELADLAEAQPSLFARHETARQKDYRVVDARRRPS
ncbi:hypothetical protein FJ658_05000 [Schumannella sp. 10F1B-5-1]|nr:hypothetical protein FJ658_05000 [Schumannella sp. 10F1B-5-1]